MDCYTSFIAKLKKQILHHIQFNHAKMVLCPLSDWISVRHCITWLVKGRSFQMFCVIIFV